MFLYCSPLSLISVVSENTMRITIRQLKKIPIPSLKTESIYCDGASENEILFVFNPPSLEVIHIGDVVELDPNILERPQIVLNMTTNTRFKTEFCKQNIHDLRLPAVLTAKYFSIFRSDSKRPNQPQ